MYVIGKGKSGPKGQEHLADGVIYLKQPQGYLPVCKLKNGALQAMNPESVPADAHPASKSEVLASIQEANAQAVRNNEDPKNPKQEIQPIPDFLVPSAPVSKPEPKPEKPKEK